MIAIILAAATETLLEREVEDSLDPELAALKGLPKALFPVGDGNTSMLEHWCHTIEKNREISHIFIVTSAAKYKYFERFATSRGIPVQCVVNDGVTRNSERLGSARDLMLGLKRAKQMLGSLHQDVMVLAGDSLFYKTFDVRGVTNFFKRKGDGSLLLYCNLGEGVSVEDRGVAVVDPKSKEILQFNEKPAKQDWEDVKEVTYTKYGIPIPADRTSKSWGDLACPMFYILRGTTVPMVERFVAENAVHGATGLGCGKLIEYLCAQSKFYGMRLPSAFSMIGTKADLGDYRALDESFRTSALSRSTTFDDLGRVVTKAHARVGLMGNPSDGYFGKTLGLSLENFWATVTLEASKTLRLVPNPLYDPSEFGSLGSLYEIGKREGYQGGMRLLMATCKKFSEFCTENGIALANRNFKVSYDTNIPRQVGLAGSSAIVTALFKALMAFYGLNETDIPLAMQPSFVLSVEMGELGINAGLQDRVVQVYEGLTYMDFEESFMKENGHGKYERLPKTMIENLPLFLAYENDPSDSGKIHSTVRQRWNDGEVAVRKAMAEFGKITDLAVAAMKEKDAGTLMELMDKNFSCRRNLFGDECLGKTNLKMIDIGKSCGAAVKFCGSGGAVVGLCKREKLGELRDNYEQNGFIFTELQAHFPAPIVEQNPGLSVAFLDGIEMGEDLPAGLGSPGKTC
jgi:glucuronokinase|eukprot:g686.t1